MTAVSPTRSDATSQNITHVVKVLMALNNIDQQTLSERIGKDPTSVNKILRGQRRWSLDDVVSLADAFDRPVGFFFDSIEDFLRNRCFRQPEQLVLDLETGPQPEQLTLIVSPGLDDPSDDGEPFSAIAA